MTEVAATPLERVQQQYAVMNASMDHALAVLLPAMGRSLPAGLALPAEEATPEAATKSWRALSVVFEARRAKLQQKEDKRRQKEEARRRKAKKQSAQESSKPAEKKPAKTTESRKNGKTKAVKADAQELQRYKRPAKAQPKTDAQAIPRTLASPRSSPTASANSFLAPDAPPPPLLARLRQLPGLECLALGTNKYTELVRWLEQDKAKNQPAPRELLKQVAKLRDRESGGRGKEANGKTPKNSQWIKEETLDDRLRAERKKKIREVAKQHAADAKPRLKRAIDESDEEIKGQASDEEPEYADGYSDSSEEEEAEFEPSEQPTRRSNGASMSSSSPGAANVSATEQLQRVVAKMKEEDLLAKDSSGQYLSYEDKASSEGKKARKNPGSSPRNAIVLDSEEDDDDDEGDSDSDSVDVEEKVEQSEEEKEAAAGVESSTDEEKDLFDLNEEDVYIVESILMVKEGRTLFTSTGKRRTKEADLYLVKWDGYNELTWEPENNIPQRLIDLFRDRERSKRACHYQIDKFVERRVVDNVTTNRKEVIYLIQWLSQAQAVWEVRATLPEKTLIWLDKVAGAHGEQQAKKRIKIYSSGGR